MIETTLTKLARVLAAKSGLRVVLSSRLGASTDGKTISIVNLSDAKLEVISERLKAHGVDLTLALNGFLDHEAAHCYFTFVNANGDVMMGNLADRANELIGGLSEFSALPLVFRRRVAFMVLKSLCNFAEDRRIEALWVSRFPGSDASLLELSRFDLALGEDVDMEAAERSAIEAEAAGILGFYNAVRGALFVLSHRPEARALYGASPLKAKVSAKVADFFARHGLTYSAIVAHETPEALFAAMEAPAVELISDILSRAHDMKFETVKSASKSPRPGKGEKSEEASKGEEGEESEEESEESEGADEAEGSEGEESEEEEESEEGSDGEESEEESEGIGAGSEGSEGEESGEEPEGEEGDEEESEGIGAGSEGSEDEESDEEADEEAEGSVDGSEGEESEEEADEESESSENGKGSGRPREEFDGEASEDAEASSSKERPDADKVLDEVAREIEEAAKDRTKSLFEDVRDEARELDGTIDDGDPLKLWEAPTTEFDKVEPVTPTGVPSHVLAGFLKAVSEVSVGHIGRKLLGEYRARHTPAPEGSRVNLRVVGSLAAGMPDFNRLFVRRETKLSRKGTVVQLVIDLSGSMSGQKINKATIAAGVLGDLLQRLGIPCEIIGFTTKGSLYHRTGIEIPTHSWTRVEPLYFPLFKSFEQPMAAALPGLAKWSWEAGDNNVDGESILFCANRLLARREARKIMIVLSDGLPMYERMRDSTGARHLKAVCKKLEATPGLELYGIGLLTAAVAQFYSKHVVLRDMAELPSLLGSLFSGNTSSFTTHDTTKAARY